jgi:hypothetical protein
MAPGQAVPAMSSFENDPIRNLVTERPRPEKKAARWRISLTFILAIAIVTVFLWGLNNQRSETGSQETAATHPMPAMPQGADQQAAKPSPDNKQKQQSGNSNSASTTGSGSAESDKLAAPQQSGAR